MTAITFVALGTSLPDTFASMSAAREAEYADAAVGNVTGSNSVNVFLGLGLPWLIGSIYAANQSEDENPAGMYYVPSGALGFSVFMFMITAATCVCILMIRRVVVKGELGGSVRGKWASCFCCCSLWVLYITMSILQSNGAIKSPL